MLVLPRIIDRLVSETGLDKALGGPQVILEGLGQIEAECMTLGTEAYTAEQRGVDLSEAVTDFDNFPHLAQVHNSLEDIWGYPLPEQLAAWVQQMWSEPEKPVVLEIRELLVWKAQHDPNRILRAFWRFLLFEAVRVNLLAVKRFNPEQYGTLGIKDDAISIHAEQEVRVFLETPINRDAGTRAFETIVGAANLSMIVHIKKHVIPWFSSLRGAYVDIMQARGKFEKLLTKLDAEGELLLRNSKADDLGEPHYSVEQLQRRHQMVLGGTKRNTLDTRLKRLRDRLLEGKRARKRRGPTLQELMEKTLNGRALPEEGTDD